MNRKDFQKLAKVRLGEAKALIRAKKWSGAYYLSGYIVEFALKACIAKQTEKYDFPDRDRVLKSHTHHIETLLVLAELKSQRDEAANSNGQFGLSWLVIREWSEQSRYAEWSEAQARNLFEAINDPTNGVLTWIMDRW